MIGLQIQGTLLKKGIQALTKEVLLILIFN